MRNKTKTVFASLPALLSLVASPGFAADPLPAERAFVGAAVMCIGGLMNKQPTDSVAAQISDWTPIDSVPVRLPTQSAAPLVWSVPSAEGQVYVHATTAGAADCAVSAYGVNAAAVSAELEKFLSDKRSMFVRDDRRDIGPGVVFTAYKPKGNRLPAGVVTIVNGAAPAGVASVHFALSAFE
jgi:hypothetical protein